LTDDTHETAESLLRQIRNLLVPISDFYQEGYEQRQGERLKARKKSVQDLLSTPTRRKAWDLADGTRRQREVSKQSKLDEGTTSKLFKSLRELGAIDGTNPKRTLEVD
jgi:hypothetical protein